MQPIDPSESEIAEACRLIRAGWSEAELRKRAAWAVTEPVVASVIDGDVTGRQIFDNLTPADADS